MVWYLLIIGKRFSQQWSLQSSTIVTDGNLVCYCVLRLLGREPLFNGISYWLISDTSTLIKCDTSHSHTHTAHLICFYLWEYRDLPFQSEDILLREVILANCHFFKEILDSFKNEF